MIFINDHSLYVFLYLLRIYFISQSYDFVIVIERKTAICANLPIQCNIVKDGYTFHFIPSMQQYNKTFA